MIDISQALGVIKDNFNAATTAAKDLATTVFYITMTVVAVLTYRRAAATLFTPLKTEVFKLQLKEMGDIHDWLVEVEKAHDESFDLDNVFKINAYSMATAYARICFPGQIEIDEQRMEERRRQAPRARVSREFVEKHVMLVGPKGDGEELRQAPEPWSEYVHEPISFTEKFHEAVQKIETLAGLPHIPSTLSHRLMEFKEQCDKSLEMVGDALTECAREMPTHYPTVDDALKIRFEWMWNHFNRKRKRVSEEAKNIRAFMADYLGLDTLYDRAATLVREPEKTKKRDWRMAKSNESRPAVESVTAQKGHSKP